MCKRCILITVKSAAAAGPEESSAAERIDTMPQTAPVKENKMGTMPVGRLLASMSIPMMLSMMVQALYNIVDSIFVSMISENALTAVSLAFPIQTLMISFAVGLAVGINAFLSRSLGQKNFENVNKSAVNGIFIELLVMAAFMLVGLFLTKPFFDVQTSDPDIRANGYIYMRIVCCCSLGIFMEVTLERILQATGRTFYSMVSQMTGAIFNIVMDPILIFGLFGAPKLGIAGAAAATVMGQHIAATLALILNLKKNDEVKFQVRGFRPDPFVLRGIFSVGLPSVIMQAIGSVMTYGMNQILISFTPTATAVFGVYFKINSMIFMPVFGLNSGAVPIISYNYGAQRKDRVIQAMKLACITAVCIMTVGFILFETIPHVFFRMFNASDNMMAIGTTAFRIIGITFPIAAFCIVCGTVFQALGKGVYSMVVSVCRQLVVLLPAAYLLSLSGELSRVWWAYVIAEVISLILSLFFLRRIWENTISRIGEPGM